MIKTCEICGKEYNVRQPNQRTCCKACGHELYKRGWRTPENDPFRPITDSTLILIEAYWREDGFGPAWIANELKRDVSVIEAIIEDLKAGREVLHWISKS